MDDVNKNIKISVIIPFFNEEEIVEELYVALKGVLDAVGLGYEILCVDDGSTDKSFSILNNISQKDKDLKIIKFRRNFGQTAAMAAGFKQAKGDIVITMDADFQNDPKDIPLLLKKMDEGYDIVSGWRKERKDSFLTRRLPSIMANKIISIVTNVKLRDYGCTLKAYKRDVVTTCNLYGEMHRFIPAIAAWAGANVAEIPVNHFPRTKGKSKYGVNRIFKVIMDIIKIKFLGDFSTKPIYVFGAIGIFFMLLGGITFLITAYRALVLGRIAATPMIFMMVIFFLGSFQFFLMGLLAELIIQIRYEVGKKDPYYIKEKINF